MKKIERFIRGDYVNYYDSEKLVEIPEDYQEKTAETRGVWFSTVANIDFPIMKDEVTIKEYLKGVINKVKEYNLNTVVFQVRPTNDAFYQSSLSPWSRFISGEEDRYPGFDLFGWFISEAKKENIEVHAWINPYRVSNLKLSDLGKTKDEFLATLSERNFARQNPSCILETVESKMILDPTSELVQEYVSDVALEIAQNYDVKAIHIDDYFYPYEAIIDPREEEKRLKLYPDLSLGDFRRQNVTNLMRKIKNKLNSLPKKVEFGISPFGIYRTNSKHFAKFGLKGGWIEGSNNHYSCYQGYDGLYADIILWMEEGLIDYVVPQVYFEFDNYIISKEDGSEIERVKYADLVSWWSGFAKKTNTKLYIGQGFYRYSDKGNWSNPEEVPNQLKYNSLYDNISGTIFFTYKNFVEAKFDSQIKAREILKTMWTKDVKQI